MRGQHVIQAGAPNRLFHNAIKTSISNTKATSILSGSGSLLGLVGNSDGLVGSGLLGNSLGNDGVVLGNLLLLGLGLSLLDGSKVSSSLKSDGGDESLDGGAEGDEQTIRLVANRVGSEGENGTNALV